MAEATALPREDPRMHLLLGDYNRYRHAYIEQGAAAKYNSAETMAVYLVYRIVLTPVEVASRWYSFYQRPGAEYESLATILPHAQGDDYVHPPNAVGLWAYHSVFPNYYKGNVFAYGAIDASAYARGGMPTVITVGLILLLMRLGFKAVAGEGPLQRIIYAISLVYFIFMPIQSSLQAMLLAHGVLGLLLVAGALRVFAFFHPEKRV